MGGAMLQVPCILSQAGSPPHAAASLNQAHERPLCSQPGALALQAYAAASATSLPMLGGGILLLQGAHFRQLPSGERASVPSS